MKTSKVKENLLKYNTARRIIQLSSFIFFSAIIFNMGTLPLLVPVLWTWGLQQNTLGDALTMIQFGFYEVVFPWLAFASFLLVGILIGKSLCGWVCPFGLIQDLVDLIKRRKNDFSLRTHESMIYLKYFILGITLLISVSFSVSKIMRVSSSYERALGIFTKAPFTALSPAETLFATLPAMVKDFRFAVMNTPFVEMIAGIATLPVLFWFQFAILIAVLVLAAYVPRGWCKYFCPHGALMAIMNKFSFIGLRRDPVKCIKGGCRLCVQACPMRVPILDLPWEKFSHEECIYCMKCVDACKNQAIKIQYP